MGGALEPGQPRPGIQPCLLLIERPDQHMPPVVASPDLFDAVCPKTPLFDSARRNTTIGQFYAEWIAANRQASSMRSTPGSGAYNGAEIPVLRAAGAGRDRHQNIPTQLKPRAEVAFYLGGRLWWSARLCRCLTWWVFLTLILPSTLRDWNRDLRQGLARLISAMSLKTGL